MKIALINGSPKANSSTSRLLLMELKKFLPEHTAIQEMHLNNPVVSKETLEALRSTDVWVLACPLYVDGIPAHLLSCLIQLERTEWTKRPILVYGIVNCGFYEGIQAESALSILQNWSVRTGFSWNGGIGVGGGGGLAQMPSMENGHGPKAPVEKALRMMADKIQQHETQKNVYVSVAFPRFLYKLAAQMGWRQMILANGGKSRDLGIQPAPGDIE